MALAGAGLSISGQYTRLQLRLLDTTAQALEKSFSMFDDLENPKLLKLLNEVLEGHSTEQHMKVLAQVLALLVKLL